MHDRLSHHRGKPGPPWVRRSDPDTSRRRPLHPRLRADDVHRRTKDSPGGHDRSDSVRHPELRLWAHRGHRHPQTGTKISDRATRGRRRRTYRHRRIRHHERVPAAATPSSARASPGDRGQSDKLHPAPTAPHIASNPPPAPLARTGYDNGVRATQRSGRRRDKTPQRSAVPRSPAARVCHDPGHPVGFDQVKPSCPKG